MSSASQSMRKAAANTAKDLRRHLVRAECESADSELRSIANEVTRNLRRIVLCLGRFEPLLRKRALEARAVKSAASNSHAGRK